MSHLRLAPAASEDSKNDFSDFWRRITGSRPFQSLVLIRIILSSWPTTSLHRQIESEETLSDLKAANLGLIQRSKSFKIVVLTYNTRSMQAPAVIAKGDRQWGKRLYLELYRAKVPLIEDYLLTEALFRAVPAWQCVGRSFYKRVALRYAEMITSRVPTK